MPPFHRPASPLALETYSPPADDIDSDGILGSDDELDEDARAARRQRIEKLAGAYLQGTPLFILSASLRGPFEEGWVNPWRKKRGLRHPHNEVEESAGPIIQETDPRHRRHFHESREQSEARSENDGQTSINQQNSHRLRDRNSYVQASRGTPKRTAAWIKDAQLNSQQLRDTSIAKPTDDKWLKRDRRRTGFREFDPPPSPTTTVSARLLDTRNRKPQPSSTRPQSSLRLQSPASATKLQNTAKTASSPNAIDRSKSTRRSEPIVHRNPTHNARTSPSKHLSVPLASAHRVASRKPSAENSFCVVSSSSQLPKFEYRRRRKHSLEDRRSVSPHQEMQHEIPIRSQSDNSQGIDQADQPEPAPTNSMSPEKPMKPSGLHDHSRDDQHPRCTFVPTAASATNSRSGLRTDQNQAESRTTHGTTSENLPSAQPVPPFPTMTDYIPSLHSTALPTNHTEHGEDDAGPDPYLSTQAAFLNAQRSFQDDLAIPDEDSQGHEFPATSADKRGPSFPISANLHNITPFNRLNEPQAGQHDSPSRAAGAAMPSTQYLVEAVTPFTFSTDKKRHAHFGSASGTKSSSKKPKMIGSEKSSPSPNCSWPESAEADWRKSYDSPSRILSSTKKQSPSKSQSPPSPHRFPWSQSPGYRAENRDLSAERRQSPQHGTVDPHGPKQEGSQTVVTGSTTAMGQDGQGGIAGESFNLSQAIADAGSWLQESFDLNKDIHRSPSHAGVSSGSARRSGLHLDTH